MDSIQRRRDGSQDVEENAPDGVILWSSLLLVVAAVGVMLLFPAQSQKAIGNVFSFTTSSTGWFYLGAVFVGVFFMFWLGFGRYGKLRFGGDLTKPEFSTFSWVAMLFCAGIGSSILYWAPLEWTYHYTSSPLGVVPKSPEAADMAVAYGFFHWGISAWAVFCLPALPIAYLYHSKKRHVLRLSSACEGVLGHHAHGWIGKVIDIAVVIGILGGLGTTLAFGVPLVTTLLSNVTGVAPSFGLQIIVILIWCSIFSASVWLGLEKGIKRLSNINIVLAIAVLLFILFVGPTKFILNSTINGLGVMLQNVIKMSLWTDPVGQSGFPQGWTIFYWAWWVSWAPFVSMFIAIISKGRTMRETVLGVSILGSVGCWIYYGIVGNYAMNLQISGAMDVLKEFKASGQEQTTVAILQSLPLSGLLVLLYLILAFVFLATSIDSAAYTLSAMSTKNLSRKLGPPKWHRILWAFAITALPIALLYVNKAVEGTKINALKVVQTSSIALALPLTVVLVLMMVSFVKDLAKDFPKTKTEGSLPRE